MGGYNLFAGLKTSKVVTVGPQADVFNYTSIGSAFDAMEPGGCMIIYPGTYSLTATETINYSCSIIGVGEVTINGGTDGIANRLIMINKPPAGTATTTVYVENIQFDNAYSGADVVEVDDDGGATGNLVTKWINCGFSATSGLAFDIDQTTNSIDCFHYIIGRKDRPFDDCNFALTKAASEIHVANYMLDNGEVFALGTADVASLYFWDNIIFSSSAFTSGGASSIIENANNCVKISSGAFTALDVGDFDATASSENLVTSALDT